MNKFLLLLLLTVSFLFAQETYKVENTEYYKDQYYSTGHPKVKRNMGNRAEFLKSKGYSEVPNGYEVDHLKPLSEGGKDEPSNMQLISVSEHRSKTASERASRSRNTSTTNTGYYSTPATYNTTTTPTTITSTPTSTDNAGRTIYTGSRGGTYYINSNGNKTYTKKD